jgi:hypothetical protein
MRTPIGDTFHAVCIIAAASDIQAARQGAWDFHKQDSEHFSDPVEKMLPGALSPTGAPPGTHFICTRHDTLEALERIEAYQKKLVAAGKPRVPVALYIAENALDLGRDLKNQLAVHELAVLTPLGLRRLA